MNPNDYALGTPVVGGVLPDWLIEKRIGIDPFVKEQVQQGVISYGVTSYGYDARCDYKFKVFTNVWGSTVDPKNFDPKSFVDVEVGKHDWEVAVVQGERRDLVFPQCVHCGCYEGPDASQVCEKAPNFVVIPPNSFALASTIEQFELPRNVLAICVGKSTYARCGIVVNVTPLEPEWRGRITVEISNTTPLPAKIYAGEGILQVVFLEGVAPCRTSYADKKGKYQNQTGLTLPFVMPAPVDG